MDWKGLKITVKLTVVNRQATVCPSSSISSARWRLSPALLPSSSVNSTSLPEIERRTRTVGFIRFIHALVKHSGNLTLDQVIKIAKILRERSYANKLAGTVKEVLGTCQ